MKSTKIAKLHDRRAAAHPKDSCFPKGSAIHNTGQTGRKPGSRNPRKVGR